MTSTRVAAMAAAAAEQAETSFLSPEGQTVYLSHIGLEEFPDDVTAVAHQVALTGVVVKVKNIKRLQVNHNSIKLINRSVRFFINLNFLDISNNRVTHICDEILNLNHLKTLVAKNNLLELSSLPKRFGQMNSLEMVHFGGNSFQEFPMQLLEMKRLKKLFLGANQIRHLPVRIGEMRRLVFLFNIKS